VSKGEAQEEQVLYYHDEDAANILLDGVEGTDYYVIECAKK
jgi:hypothetical protein